MKKVRKHIFFSGHVQGVGFRYRAQYVAQNYGLTGWVKNLWDGQVEMEIQGNEQDIYALIGALSSGSFVQIEDYRISDLTVDEQENRFRIR